MSIKPRLNGEEVYTRDVSLGKQKLSDSSIFESAMTKSPDAIMMTDLNGYVQFVNSAWAKLHDYRASELIGKHFGIFHSEIKFEEEITPLLSKIKMTKSLTTEIDHKKKNGTNFLCWVSINLVRNKKRRPSHLLWIARDITERKQSEDLYKTLANNSYSCIYIVQDGKVKYLNHNAIEYGGLSAEEILGMESISFAHPDDRKIARENAIKMLKGEITAPYEIRCLGKNGTLRTIIETVTSITYKGKRAVLGNSLDISELKEAQNKFEEERLLKGSILDTIPLAVLGLEKRRIFFANRAVETIFGWRPEELVGRSTKILYRNYDEYKKVGDTFVHALETRRVFYAEPEYPFLHKEGREIFCRVSLSWIGKPLDDNRNVAVYENITERKQISEALRQKRIEAEIQARNLEETNTALEVLLKKREKDKSELAENFVTNTKQLIFPYLEKLKKRKLDVTTKSHLNIIETNLQNIVSPFLRTMSAEHLQLSPKEMLIASLIKDGMINKEIGDLLNISTRGVEFHRNNIRKKLGLKNKKLNLRSHLLSLNN